MQVIDEDYTMHLQKALAKDNILFFTNQGRVYSMKVYEIPESSRVSRGTPIINLVQLQPEEKVTAMLAQRELNTEGYIVMATRDGVIKKTPSVEYRNVRKNGLLAISLKDDDELIRVQETTGSQNILLVTKKGMSIYFNEEEIRLSGRASIGVRGIKLSGGDAVVGMEVESADRTVLFVAENGIGKRSKFEDFTLQGRGGKGARCYKVVDKTGEIVSTETVNEEEEVMLITTEGIMIRTPVTHIPVLGKMTSGVKLMALAKDSEAKIASFTVVDAEDEKAAEEDEENPEVL